jgi:hypothetical protein
MILALVILALAIFLAGACAGIFAALVLSIHRARRTPFLSAPRGSRPDAIARRALTGIRDDREEAR